MNCKPRTSFPALAILTVATLGPAVALADEPAPAPDMVNPHAKYGFGFTGGVFIDGGGDDVITVVFTDGSSDTLTTGDGFGFNIGGRYRPQGTRVDLSATVGYKLDDITASNASVDISRKTFELHLDYFLNNDFWIGFGPVFHRGIKVDGGGFVPNFTFDDAAGMNVRVGWKAIALSHTTMDYSVAGFSLDASSTGLLLQGRF